MLGCMTAVGLVTVGGCIVLGIWASGMSDAVEKARKEQRASPTIEKHMEKMHEDLTPKNPIPNQPRVTKPKAPRPTNPSTNQNFDFKNVVLRSEFGALRVIGEVTNKSGKDYTLANFGVSLYDEDGRLLDTGAAIVSNLANGQTKSFEAMFLGIQSSEVDKYKIDFENGL